MFNKVLTYLLTYLTTTLSRQVNFVAWKYFTIRVECDQSLFGTTLLADGSKYKLLADNSRGSKTT